MDDVGEGQRDHQRALGADAAHQHAQVSAAHLGIEEILALPAGCDRLGAIVDRDGVLLALRNVCTAVRIDHSEDARRGAEGGRGDPIQTESLVPLARSFVAAAGRREAEGIVSAA